MCCLQELGNETVLLDLKQEIYYGLDDVSSACGSCSPRAVTW